MSMNRKPSPEEQARAQLKQYLVFVSDEAFAQITEDGLARRYRLPLHEIAYALQVEHGRRQRGREGTI